MTGDGERRLAALAARARDDLRKLGEPAPAWPATPTGFDADVAVVGAGQCGLAAAFALKRAGVAALRIVSADPLGQEGPWRTFARMPTLRSPKTAPGPELGLPALTYESWHVARHGDAHYQALDLIATEDWAAYIDWFREAVGLTIETGRQVVDIDGDTDGVVTRFRDGGQMRVRQLILATGMDAMGRPRMPAELESLPPDLRLDAYGPIDFARLAGKRVAVVGGASTAFDNAATALETGAAAVDLYARQPELRAVNHMKGIAQYGVVAHWADFDDATRWRLARLGAGRSGPPTGPTVARACRHRNFRIRLSAPIETAAVDGGQATLLSCGVVRRYDAVIVAAGYAIDPEARPELGRIVRHAACWSDRYAPPPGEADAGLAAHPYLDTGFAFTERTAGEAPWLARVRLFAGPAVVSMGRIVGESGNLKYGVPRLARAVALALATEDRAALFDTAAGYDVRETNFADYAARVAAADDPTAE